MYAIGIARLWFLDAEGAIVRRKVITAAARRARREIEACQRQHDLGTLALRPDLDFAVPTFREAYRSIRHEVWGQARSQADTEAARRAHAALPVVEQLARSCELEAELARGNFPPDYAKAEHFTALAAQARGSR